MSDEPSGAIDNTFDDTERDARSILEENLSAFAAEVNAGDVVIDMVENRPLFVRRKKADTAVEYFEDHDFDLTTYKAHPWLPITPDDTIFETVFIPTKLKDIPTSTADKTYDYPRGRLARVPLEFLWNDRTRYASSMVAAVLAGMLSAADDRAGDDADDPAPTTIEVVARDVYEDATVDDAVARAGIDPAAYDDDSAELGDFE